MRRLAVKTDLTMQAHDAIKQAILSSELPPGAALAQEELAASLGVSRQPVSHALLLLRREGLVVDRGRKGQMVARIDAARLLAHYQVRGALDRLAARLAAARTADLVTLPQRLDGLLANGNAAVAKGQIDRLVETDVAFHTAVYELSQNSEIAATAESAWPHMVRSMRVVLTDSAYRKRAWTEHEAIAAAIVAGDVDRAGTLAVNHAEAAGEATYHRLKDGETGPNLGSGKQIAEPRGNTNASDR